MREREKLETSMQTKRFTRKRTGRTGNPQGTQYTDCKKSIEEKTVHHHKASNVSRGPVHAYVEEVTEMFARSSHFIPGN